MATRSKRWRNKRDERMSLGEHMQELRKRLFISAIAIVVAAVGGFFLSDFVMDGLRVPIEQIAESRNATIMYTTVTGSFDLKIMIAVTLAIVIAAPIWMYQIFAFLVPGLTKKEKQYTFGFFFAAVPLFIGGAAAGWFVFPHMVELLTSFAGDQEAVNLDARVYFDFVLKLMLAVGVAFVLPVFLVLLNFIGILSAKAIIKGWRIAILVIVVFCAMATPAADVMSMFLLAVPMIVLYFVAYGIAWLNDRRRAKRNREVETALGEPSTI